MKDTLEFTRVRIDPPRLAPLDAKRVERIRAHLLHERQVSFSSPQWQAFLSVCVMLCN